MNNILQIYDLLKLQIFQLLKLCSFWITEYGLFLLEYGLVLVVLNYVGVWISFDKELCRIMLFVLCINWEFGYKMLCYGQIMLINLVQK